MARKTRCPTCRERCPTQGWEYDGSPLTHALPAKLLPQPEGDQPPFLRRAEERRDRGFDGRAEVRPVRLEPILHRLERRVDLWFRPADRRHATRHCLTQLC